MNVICCMSFSFLYFFFGRKLFFKSTPFAMIAYISFNNVIQLAAC